MLVYYIYHNNLGMCLKNPRCSFCVVIMAVHMFGVWRQLCSWSTHCEPSGLWLLRSIFVLVMCATVLLWVNAVTLLFTSWW